MSAEHGPQHGIVLLFAVGNEIGVFLNGLQTFFLAVPVGNLIAQAGADAKALGGLGDGKQGTGNLAVGGVVVKNSGDTLLDAVHIQRVGRGAGT